MSTETQEKPEPIKVIDLEYPIQIGKEEKAQLKIMRRPKAKDLKGLNMIQMQSEDVCKLLGRISDFSTPELEELDLMDFNKVGEVMKSFLPSIQEAGKAT